MKAAMFGLKLAPYIFTVAVVLVLAGIDSRYSHWVIPQVDERKDMDTEQRIASLESGSMTSASRVENLEARPTPKPFTVSEKPVDVAGAIQRLTSQWASDRYTLFLREGLATVDWVNQNINPCIRFIIFGEGGPLTCNRP